MEAYVRLEGHLLSGQFDEDALKKGEILKIRWEDGGLEGYFKVQKVGKIDFDTIKGVPYIEKVKSVKSQKVEKMGSKGDTHIHESEFSVHR